MTRGDWLRLALAVTVLLIGGAAVLATATFAVWGLSWVQSFFCWLVALLVVGLT